MKKFVFPLEQIRSWNATRLKIEETELEALVDRLRRQEAAFADASAQRTGFADQTLRQSVIETEQLARIEQFRIFLQAEARRLQRAQAEFARQIAERRQRVVELKRKIELLDRLRQRQHQAWSAEEVKELQNAADEAFLQKLVAKRVN